MENDYNSELAHDDSEFKARSYQEQLLEMALNENSIIYLPTGAGKTFIALMAIKELSKNLHGSISEGGKRIAFICNTVALANQQYNVIKKRLNLKVEVFTSEKEVDSWNQSKWKSELNENQVFVATCQIIVNIVAEKYISVNNFALMIFDECHNCIGDHPMHTLMDMFRDANQKDLPRVIGLTGTLLNSSKPSRISNDLKKLEAVLRAKIITVENMDDYQDVLIYSTKPKEFTLPFEDDININTNVMTLQSKIEKIVLDCCEKIRIFKIDEVKFVYSKNLNATRAPNPITKAINLLKDFIFQMKELGMFAASIACLAILIEIEIKKRSVETDSYKAMLRIIITTMEHINHLICNEIYADKNKTTFDVMLNNSTIKLKTFLLYLENTFKDKAMSEVKCLVFVDRRYTAKVLYHIIKKISDEKKDLQIVPDFVVGRDNMAETIENYIENFRNNNTLQNFRDHKTNLIVTSAVLEEGIDLQACNFVIIFDEVKSFRSYVQTKGRARMNDSNYVIMIPKSKSQKFLENLKSFKYMDAMLKENLVGKTIDRKIPTVFEINGQFDVKIEPFKSEIGAVLRAEAAIPILNRYCQFLYGKNCTSSTIHYSKEDLLDGKFRITIELPLLSALREKITSDSMPNIKWAKRSAAFKACKLLYLSGELNKHFLPTTIENTFEDLKQIYFQHLNDSSNEELKNCGSKNRRQQYEINYPNQICQAKPQLKVNCFLYEIVILPKFNKEGDNNSLIDLLNNNDNYAILTSKELPKLAEISLFISQTEILVKVSANPIHITINSETDFEKLKKFHITIFRNVIQSTWSNCVAYDPQNNQNSYLIVPILNSKVINWELVDNFQHMPRSIELTELQRKNLKIISNNYLNNMIIPWYSADKNQFYVVKSILNHLNPMSNYPEKKYANYVFYMKQEYNINVIQANQFLLEVNGISFAFESNFLTLKDSKIKSKTITLIPELCTNFKFPGIYWLKAKLIPSIIHRIHYLLHAENLRIDMNKYLKIKCDQYVPLPINYANKISENIIENNIIPSNLPQTDMYTKLNFSLYSGLIDLNQLEKLRKLDIDYHCYFKSQLSSYENNSLNDQFKPIILETKNISNNIPIINMLKVKDKFNGPEQYEILKALTTTGAQDIFDNERLELLGDAFLKFSISLFTLCNNPTWNEGRLTAIKSEFVSNKNLLYLAKKLEIPGKINSKKFQASKWLPPSISPPSNIKKFIEINGASETIFSDVTLDDDEIEIGIYKLENLEKLFKNLNLYKEKNENDFSVLLNMTYISDKVCADVMEALLGVCVKNYGIEKSFLMLDYFGICPCKTNLLKASYPNQKTDSKVSNEEIDKYLLNYTILENNISYKFKDRGYLLAALTHPSYASKMFPTSCYQQLEFIGDAIIDFLITMYIYEQCKDKTPGELTDIRSALVNNITFACIAVRYKLHLFLLSQSPSLFQSIAKFVEFQEKHDYEITDLNLLFKKNVLISDHVDTPKPLGDIFEAIIGAIFLDSGNSLEETWKVLYNLMQYELNEFLTNVPIQIVRQLIEYSGARPTFHNPVVKDNVVSVKCTFYCRDKLMEVVGVGTNKKQAKNSSAKAALKVLTE